MSDIIFILIVTCTIPSLYFTFDRGLTVTVNFIFTLREPNFYKPLGFFLGFLATFICFCVTVLFYRYLYFVVNQKKLQSCKRPSYDEYRGKELSVSNENFKFKIRKHPCVNCTERSGIVRRYEIHPQLKAGRSSWRICRHASHLFDLQKQLPSLNVEKNHRSVLLVGTLP